jgi:hypothetical protein
MCLDDRFQILSHANITLAGIELAHRIRKRQFRFGPGRPKVLWSLKQMWERALVA